MFPGGDGDVDIAPDFGVLFDLVGQVVGGHERPRRLLAGQFNHPSQFVQVAVKRIVRELIEGLRRQTAELSLSAPVALLENRLGEDGDVFRPFRERGTSITKVLKA